MIRLRYAAIVLFAVTCGASALALDHMDSLPALLLIAPGYLVQAWLFETNRALGGLGYQVTIVGVSALAWTLAILGVTISVRYLLRRVRGRRVA